MTFTEYDIEKIINTDNVLEGDNIIASVKFTDCYEVYALSMYDQSSHSRLFNNIKDVVDYLNELENTPICFLATKNTALLKTMSQYYSTNCNKTHRNIYIWNLLHEVYDYCQHGKDCEMKESDFDKLNKWFKFVLNNPTWDSIYWYYANGEQQLS